MIIQWNVGNGSAWPPSAERFIAAHHPHVEFHPQIDDADGWKWDACERCDHPIFPSDEVHPENRLQHAHCPEVLDG